MIKKAKTHVWDAAAKLDVYRQPPQPTFYAVEKLEPGVNYFVLMLEQLGAIPHFSCEGHPNSFYVVFEAPMSLAEKIRACGYFTIELEGPCRWSLRINRDVTESERKMILRAAAAAWEEKLGPLDAIAGALENAPIRKTRKCKR